MLRTFIGGPMHGERKHLPEVVKRFDTENQPPYRKERGGFFVLEALDSQDAAELIRKHKEQAVPKARRRARSTRLTGTRR